MKTTAASKNGVAVRVKPEKKQPWESIDEELDMIFNSQPVADADYDGPTFKDQVVRLREVIFALRKNNAPAPVEITPFDGHFIQIMWVLENDQRVYADIENLEEISVTYTYADRTPTYKTVKDPLKILPKP